MIIIGLTGPICAGKKTAAEFFQICYGFSMIDLEDGDLDSQAQHTKDTYNSEEEYREANSRTALSIIEENSEHNYVVYPFTLQDELHVFRQSPCFMLLGIETPVLKRYELYTKKYKKKKSALQNFMDIEDKINFGLNGYPAQVYECIYTADKVVFNRGDKEDLYNEIRALDIMNPEHFRPSWDTYFMRLAEMASTRSNCMKRPVGAVVVKENRVVSMGYNGTPTGTTNCIDGGCRRCNSAASAGTKLEDCMCVHGEMNALLIAGRFKCQGCTLYTTLFPCLLCTKGLIQTGIKRVVYCEDYSFVDDSIQLLQEAGVDILKHSPVVPSPF